jgi:hypothetical protein
MAFRLTTYQLRQKGALLTLLEPQHVAPGLRSVRLSRASACVAQRRAATPRGFALDQPIPATNPVASRRRYTAAVLIRDTATGSIVGD